MAKNQLTFKQKQDLVPPPPITQPSVMQMQQMPAPNINTGDFDNNQLNPPPDQSPPGVDMSQPQGVMSMGAPGMQQPSSVATSLTPNMAAQGGASPDNSGVQAAIDNVGQHQGVDPQLMADFNETRKRYENRQEEGFQAQQKMFSMLAKENEHDKRQQRASELFGNLIAPAMGMMGGPAGAAAGVAVTQQAQQQAIQQKAENSRGGLEAAKMLNDMYQSSGKDGLNTMMSYLKVSEEQRKDQADLERQHQAIARDTLSFNRQKQAEQALAATSARQEANARALGERDYQHQQQQWAEFTANHKLAGDKFQFTKDGGAQVINPTTGKPTSARQASLDVQQGANTSAAKGREAVNDPNTEQNKKAEIEYLKNLGAIHKQVQDSAKSLEDAAQIQEFLPTPEGAASLKKARQQHKVLSDRLDALGAGGKAETPKMAPVSTMSPAEWRSTNPNGSKADYLKYLDGK